MKRAGLLALAVLVALAGTVGLIAFLQGRDEAEISGGGGREPGVEAPSETAATLQRGNVLLTYREAADAAALRGLAEDIAGAAEPALVDAGQAVIVERRADQGERIVGHAYRRRIAAQTAQDPALREFVEAWLGQGGLRP